MWKDTSDNEQFILEIHDFLSPRVKYLCAIKVYRVEGSPVVYTDDTYIHTSRPTSSGPGSGVGIATAYGLGGPGIESRWGRDFPHVSRSALRPTQPPIEWVTGLSRG